MTYTKLRMNRKHTPSADTISTWTYFERFIKATAWITFSLAILFHFTGQVAQQSYSEKLGIKGSLFEKSLYQIEIKGMLSVIGTFSNHLPSDDQQRNFLLITLIIALCAGFIFCIYKWLAQKFPVCNWHCPCNRNIGSTRHNDIARISLLTCSRIWCYGCKLRHK